MGRGAAKTTGVAATTGQLWSTALMRGSRASTLRHNEESGTHVVGAFAVSPSRAAETCSASPPEETPR